MHRSNHINFCAGQICLVDKDSGLFFWFNCKDETSQWADTEGEGWAGYGSRRASAAPDLVYTNSLVGSCKNLVPGGFGTPPNRSPRGGPSHADDQAAGVYKHGAPSSFASPGKKIERKMNGIAEMAEGGSTRELNTADEKDSETEAKAEGIADSSSSKGTDDKETKEESASASVKAPSSKGNNDLQAESKKANKEEEADSKDGIDAKEDATGNNKQETPEESKKESSAPQASPRIASPRAASPRALSPRAAVSTKDPSGSAKSTRAVSEESNADTAPPAPSSPRPPVSPRADESAAANAASVKADTSKSAKSDF